MYTRFEPKDVPKVNTKNRNICTKIPVEDSIPILKGLQDHQPHSLDWQAPIIWDRAEGFNIYDKYGNKWIDMSSGIAVANTGHAPIEVIEAISKQLEKKMLYNFTFPSEVRLQALKKIADMTPKRITKGFFMSSGSEATENALKLMRGWAIRTQNKEKNIIISFENAFHGRTLGAQMMGGLPGLKDWIKNLDPDIYQVPFPDGYIHENISFETFTKSLQDQKIEIKKIAGVIVEGFQGANVDFMPIEYGKALRKWCDDNNVLLCFDEVQSGFARTGAMFGFELLGIEPDLICFGKGIAGVLPISACFTRPEIMDVFNPGEMTSTFTGNPLSCAAAVANLELYEKYNLVEKAQNIGKILQPRVREFAEKYEIVGHSSGKGAIAGLSIVKPGTKEGDKDVAFQINQKLYEKGVMMFAPVGRGCVKIAPPLIISEEALTEALDVIEEAIQEI